MSARWDCCEAWVEQVIPARSIHKLAVMGGLQDYVDRLLEHADKDQYHPVLFGGPLPEGLEDTGEDDMGTWSAATVPPRDKKAPSARSRATLATIAACPFNPGACWSRW